MTDLQRVKDVTKGMFDLISIKDAIDAAGDLAPLVISHPFANSGMVFVGGKFINLVEEPERAEEFKDEVFRSINTTASLTYIGLMVNKPYLLLWFKLIRHLLSPEDYGNALRDVWIHSEFPNADANVSVSESIRFFRAADRKYLMEADDYKQYNELPDKITVWRGVTKGKNPIGLSYTTDKARAEWFQNRWPDVDNPGYLLELTVSKQDILAYIDSRGEQEVIVDISKYKEEITNMIANKEVI